MRITTDFYLLAKVRIFRSDEPDLPLVQTSQGMSDVWKVVIDCTS